MEVEQKNELTGIGSSQLGQSKRPMFSSFVAVTGPLTSQLASFHRPMRLSLPTQKVWLNSKKSSRFNRSKFVMPMDTS